MKQGGVRGSKMKEWREISAVGSVVLGWGLVSLDW